MKEIEGYEKLSVLARKVFDRTHQAHQKAIDNKEAWQVVKVKERKAYIEVYFYNGQWLHYKNKGTWY